MVLQGDVPQSTRVNVPIKIMNEATPVFEHQFYTVSISENTPLHSAIITIEASSPTGAKLIYSITNGDIYGEFSVDFSTGELIVIKCLNCNVLQRACQTERRTSSSLLLHTYK